MALSALFKDIASARCKIKNLSYDIPIDLGLFIYHMLHFKILCKVPLNKDMFNNKFNKFDEKESN